jgi:chaperonin cofactor prefoldin
MLYDEIVHFDERIETLELKLKVLSEQNEDCQRLLTIPGVLNKLFSL